MKRLPFLAGTLAISLIMNVATPASAATLINGGLNLLPGDEGEIITVVDGLSYNGWTGYNGVEFVGVAPGIREPSAEGNGFVDLNGTLGSGGITQGLTTQVGQLYRIDFALSGNPGPDGHTVGINKPMAVLWNSGLAGDFTFVHEPDETHRNLRWEYHSVFVTGTGFDTLRFESTGGTDDSGPMIDDISITAIPEPSSALLIFSGALLLFRRNRR